jgi:hypothetical protein
VTGMENLDLLFKRYDTNKDLMFVWKYLKLMGIEFIAECEKLFTDKKGTLYSLNWLPL